MPSNSHSAITQEITTVLIADTNRMDCQLLAAAIQRKGGLRVVGYATSSNEMCSWVQTRPPDVALISARLQDGALAGFKVVQEWHRLYPASRIVVLLDADEREHVVKAFRTGARGVFCRNGSSQELRKCIQTVHSGQIWANRTQMEYIVAALMETPVAKVRPGKGTIALGKREQEVCDLVAAGFSNREISKKLKLSEHTIKNHLFQIFDKLAISSRVELVLYSISEARLPQSTKEDNSSEPSYKFGT
jgi:DNA-binding NarL/FixJ family response regulator